MSIQHQPKPEADVKIYTPHCFRRSESMQKMPDESDERMSI